MWWKGGGKYGGWKSDCSVWWCMVGPGPCDPPWLAPCPLVGPFRPVWPPECVVYAGLPPDSPMPPWLVSRSWKREQIREREEKRKPEISAGCPRVTIYQSKHIVSDDDMCFYLFAAAAFYQPRPELDLMELILFFVLLTNGHFWGVSPPTPSSFSPSDHFDWLGELDARPRRKKG